MEVLQANVTFNAESDLGGVLWVLGEVGLGDVAGVLFRCALEFARTPEVGA